MTKKRRLTSGEGWSLESDRDRSADALQSKPPQEQTISLATEKRGAKRVTLLSGFSHTPAELKALAKQLKTACGTGGTVREGWIELQGECVEAARTALQQRGYRIR